MKTLWCKTCGKRHKAPVCATTTATHIQTSENTRAGIRRKRKNRKRRK